MQALEKFTPFVLSLSGILSDYLTTRIGLGLGFQESNANYHPLNALCIFWVVAALLTTFMPKEKHWVISIHCIALAPYLGMVNNLLVIFGLFSGLFFLSCLMGFVLCFGVFLAIFK